MTTKLNLLFQNGAQYPCGDPHSNYSYYNLKKQCVRTPSTDPLRQNVPLTGAAIPTAKQIILQGQPHVLEQYVDKFT